MVIYVVSEKFELERVKHMINGTKRELLRLNAELKAKTARRNSLLNHILRIRREEHHLRQETAKLDSELYHINNKIREHQRTMNEAKRLGLW